jgi:hypothetical protein
MSHQVAVARADTSAVDVAPEVPVANFASAPHPPEGADNANAAAAVALMVVARPIESNAASAFVQKILAEGILSATTIIVAEATTVAGSAANSVAAEQSAVFAVDPVVAGHRLLWDELKAKGKQLLFNTLLATLTDEALETMSVDPSSEAQFFDILTSLGTDHWAITVPGFYVLQAGWHRMADAQFPLRKKPSTVKQCQLLLPKDITFAFECARLGSNSQFEVTLTSPCPPDINGATLADE